MRNFYVSFPESENLPPLVAELSWTNLYLILEKCKDPQEREFYFRMTRKFGWIKEVLAHNIDIKSYERYLTNQTNFDSQLPDVYKYQAMLAIKDSYTFDFLDLMPQHSEKELERELIANIRNFLVAIGGMYSFIGSQYRLIVDSKSFMQLQDVTGIVRNPLDCR